MVPFRSITWKDNRLILLDQRQLPHQTVYLDYRQATAVAEAIREMVVRGAPAIGVTAAFGMVLAAQQSEAATLDQLQQDLHRVAQQLLAARPTAVNLAWAVQRLLAVAQTGPLDDLRQRLLAEAQAIYAEDIEINRQIGLTAQPLIPDAASVIHHCNTGALATVVATRKDAPEFCRAPRAVRADRAGRPSL
ncbi:MAG: hypothetical protein F6J97_23190 [Leptolyngbya sp. SIO4C1]|nr:hypothetical protein [Leptolyngbya sp. SIO4C1]